METYLLNKNTHSIYALQINFRFNISMLTRVALLGNGRRKYTIANQEKCPPRKYPSPSKPLIACYSVVQSVQRCTDASTPADLPVHPQPTAPCSHSSA